MSREKAGKVFDGPSLSFIHLCQRFYLCRDNGIYDIIGCINKIIVPFVVGEGETYRSTPSGVMYLASGIRGIRNPEVVKIEVTHFEDGTRAYESSQYVNHNQPADLALVIFGIKDLVFPKEGLYVINLFVGDDLIGHTLLNVGAFRG